MQKTCCACAFLFASLLLSDCLSLLLKRTLFALLYSFLALFVRLRSLFALCAFLSPFVCLSFGLTLTYSPCSPHILSEQLRPLFSLSPLSFGLALKYSACLPPSFLLFFAVQPALPTSCPVLVLSLASLCFSFVFYRSVRDEDL